MTKLGKWYTLSGTSVVNHVSVIEIKPKCSRLTKQNSSSILLYNRFALVKKTIGNELNLLELTRDEEIEVIVLGAVPPSRETILLTRLAELGPTWESRPPFSVSNRDDVWRYCYRSRL